MHLDALLAEAGLTDSDVRIIGVEEVVGGSAGLQVTSVTMDSRRVGPGDLFACVSGQHRDGHEFASEAVERGASVLLVEHFVDLRVPQVMVSSVRAALGPLADAVHGHPSASLAVVGVTGTNGKTTTCALLRGIFEAHGWSASTIGTLSQPRTTPEAPDLQAQLAELRDRGTAAVAIEVSSHALAQHRADATRFAAGVLTNVTQDHLDYHRTMDAYFDAKARLFEPGRVGVAVVNRDDRWGQVLLQRNAESRVPTETFGMDDASELALTAQGSTFRWGGVAMRVHLGGRFNVLNALAAATTARSLAIPVGAIAAGLEATAAVRGRFEPVDAGQPFTVLVDYAHTPDGLAQALAAARELASGRLLVVFGAGGERDQEKRPLMGNAASRLADLAVVTSDNPRHEDPHAIIDQIVAGAVHPERMTVQADRRAAIATAISAAGPGDVVVIAGKGHEPGQDLGDRVVEFDDVTEARTALARILDARRGRQPPAVP